MSHPPATTERPSITDAATAFAHSYARAMHLTSPSISLPTSLPSVAAALAAHYSPTIGTVSFFLGMRVDFQPITTPTNSDTSTTTTSTATNHPVPAPDTAPNSVTDGILAHLQRFETSSLGLDIEHVASKLRVEAISDGSALCWITWRIKPRAESGVEGWEFENVYAYRRGAVVPGESEGGEGLRIGGEDGWVVPKGWWEFIVSDNEIAGLLGRVPGFFA